MAGFPRYDEIQQRSIHNAYFKQEQLIDQLLHHRARTIELDLHRWLRLGCPYRPDPDWGIYHTIGEAGDNLCRLGEALQLLQAFQAGDPTHEVVTVHLELKSRSTGEAVGTFDDHTADDLDAKLIEMLGRQHLFTPADLLAANPGAPSLLAAVGRGGASAGGWPTIDALRGKFIVVVHGEAEIDLYATAANATRRVSFLMREVLWPDDARIRQHGHVVFHGEVDTAQARGLRSRFPGLILRSRQADDPASFFAAQGSSVNLILTDRVDVHSDPWARMHTDRLFPFSRAGLQGESGRNHSSVRDLDEQQQFYRLATHSGDVGGTADSCSFAHTRAFPPRMSGAGSVDDVWMAMVASASNTTVDGWGKCMLMARDGLHAGARYVAVGRAADDHGLFMQWRERDGGDTTHIELGDYTYRVDGRDTHLDRESVHWVRLLIREQPFDAKRFVAYGSIDGRQWRTIGEVTQNGAFAFRGLAACGQFSRHANSPGVEYHIQHLRRNGNFPVDFETVDIGSADFSRLTRFGAPVRRRSVLISLANRTDTEVILRQESRRGATVLCNANRQSFIWSDVQIASTATYHAQPRDYVAPVIDWTVGGVTLPRTRQGEASVPTDQRRVVIRYAVDQAAGTLTLSNRPEEGAYGVEVQATATEQDGSNPVRSNRLSFGVTGRRAGFGSDYHHFVSACLRETLNKLRVRPSDILRPRPPRPNEPREFLINQARLAQVIRDLELAQPAAAAELRALSREVTESAR